MHLVQKRSLSRPLLHYSLADNSAGGHEPGLVGLTRQTEADLRKCAPRDSPTSQPASVWTLYQRTHRLLKYLNAGLYRSVAHPLAIRVPSERAAICLFASAANWEIGR